MRLEDICTVFTDGDWIESKDQSDEGIRLVQTGNIGKGIYLEKEARAKYISEDTFEKLKCTEIFPGDILVSRLPEPVGRACIIPDKEERMITAVDCTICRPDETVISKEYLCYFMRSNAYYTRLLGSVTGTTRKRISRKNLGNVELDVPSREKQNEVVEQLDHLVNVIDSKTRELQLLDDLIQARFVEMFGDPVQNTKGWNIDTCKNLTSKIGSGATPKGGRESYGTEGISLIRSMNVYNNRFEYKDLAYITDEQADKLSNVTIEENDVLLNITGASVARCCAVPKELIPARVNQHVAIVRCKDRLLPEFLCSMFTEDSYQRLLWSIATSGGATREAITKQQIEDLVLIVPPIELQQQFVDFCKQVNKLKLATSPQTTLAA
jgi:type I restriction enzyme S subunit